MTDEHADSDSMTAPHAEPEVTSDPRDLPPDLHPDLQAYLMDCYAPVVDRFRAGEDLGVIARENGMSRATAELMLHRAGFRLRQRPKPSVLSDRDRETISVMSLTGSSIAQMAVHFDVSPDQIRNALRAEGIGRSTDVRAMDPDHRGLIVERFAAGQAIVDLVAAFGYSTAQVTSVLRRASLVTLHGQRRPSADRDALVQALHQQQVPAETIAVRLDMSLRAVTAAIRRGQVG